MSRPLPPPRLVRDAMGRTRLKIKPGRPSGFGNGAHAQWFSVAGARSTRDGSPVGGRSQLAFARAVWDLPDTRPLPTHGDAPPDLDAALSLLGKSNLFRANLEAIQRDGWSLAVAQPDRPQALPGCRKGPNEIVVDATPRGAFVANVARYVALARAVGRPFPALDPLADGDDFARRNAIYLLRADAESRLDTALVRDELLARGAADIGGPGLRGSQFEAYYAHAEGAASRDQAITAIASSADGVEGGTFRSGRGPRAVDQLARAFLYGGSRTAPPLSAEVIDVVRRIRALPFLDQNSVARGLGVTFEQAAANPSYLTFAGDLGGDSFTRTELRVSRVGAGVTARLVLAPRTDRANLSLASFRGWFGRGAPHHLELGAAPQATIALPSESHTAYVTYALLEAGSAARDEGVTALTFEARSQT